MEEEEADAFTPPRHTSSSGYAALPGQAALQDGGINLPLSVNLVRETDGPRDSVQTLATKKGTAWAAPQPSAAGHSGPQV